MTHLKNSLKSNCAEAQTHWITCFAFKEHLTADLHTQTQLILVTQGHKNFALNKKRWNYDTDVQQSRFSCRSVRLLLRAQQNRLTRSLNYTFSNFAVYRNFLHHTRWSWHVIIRVSRLASYERRPRARLPWVTLLSWAEAPGRGRALRGLQLPEESQHDWVITASLFTSSDKYFLCNESAFVAALKADVRRASKAPQNPDCAVQKESVQLIILQMHSRSFWTSSALQILAVP